MPVSFEFVPPNGERVLLSQVDEEICAEVKEPVDPDKYNPYYTFVTEVGIGALMHSGGSQVTPEVLEEHLSYMYQEPWRDGFTKEGVELAKSIARKFLVEKYTFRAWRGM